MAAGTLRSALSYSHPAFNAYFIDGLPISLKGERLKEIVHHITSYTRILQLSLSTLSLGELWIYRQSQEMILAEVQRINRDIRATEIFSGRTETRTRNIRELPLISTPQLDMPPADGEARSFLAKEIREWRETADEIAAAVSLSIPYDEPTDERQTVSLHNSTSSTTLPTFDDDISDSEPEELDEAAEYQRRGIRRRKLLDDGLSEQGNQDGDASSASKLIDMEEKLADILFHCDTTETDKEAKKVIEELLDHERERIETDDTDRQWRLYHKLGNLCVRQGNFLRSRKFLKNAFMGRSRANPRRKSLIIDSAEMLIKSLQALQLIDEARGIRSWLEEELPAESYEDHGLSPQPSPRTSVCEDNDLGSPYRWSIEQGFDVHSPHFGFNVCDPQTGNAPIHRAIQHENLEVLQSMLSNIPQAEQRDSSGSTPMHLAASTRNKRVCAVLLDKAANVGVVDQK
ncbi:hypothetical protein F4824DRAFT_505390 [Ustulina deusta]|nr:hypothetical protein F4824DRAFT_505390 [Ustulina deusta]